MLHLFDKGIDTGVDCTCFVNHCQRAADCEHHTDNPGGLCKACMERSEEIEGVEIGFINALVGRWVYNFSAGVRINHPGIFPAGNNVSDQKDCDHNDHQQNINMWEHNFFLFLHSLIVSIILVLTLDLPWP